MNRLHRLIAGLLLLISFQAQALTTGEMVMIRSSLSFPETMSNLQTAIKDQGYTLSRVQRVDIGLTTSGYKTDRYRIVFFGKPDEIHQLSTEHPELIPYLPLKIAIFAEDEETILVTANPRAYSDMFPEDKLIKTFSRWKKDITAIFKAVQFPD